MRDMTTLERRRNWKISVYGREHGIAHIHVTGPDFCAVVGIADGAVLAGRLPNTVHLQVQEWLLAHADEALAHWARLNPDM